MIVDKIVRDGKVTRSGCARGKGKEKILICCHDPGCGKNKRARRQKIGTPKPRDLVLPINHAHRGVKLRYHNKFPGSD
jgi:hypothetical protein